jgi:ribonuclease HI
VTGHWEQGVGLVGLPDWRCYTDGSLMDGDTGVGASIWNDQKEEICVISGKLNEGTVFQAELFAVEIAAITVKKWLVRNEPKDITFLIDSQATILALKSNSINSKSVQTAKSALIRLCTLNVGGRVHLEWIKAHVGYKGNEAADNAAKKGGKSRRGGGNPPKARCTINRNLADLFTEIWENRWLTQRPLEFRRSRFFLNKPKKCRAKDLLQLNRADAGRIVRWITGHAFLRRQNAVVEQSIPAPFGDIHCRSCDIENIKEEANHIILDCEAFCQTRNNHLGAFFLGEKHLDWEVNSLNQFLHSPAILELEEEEDPYDLN